MRDKPSLVETVEAYGIQLRRAGKELVGLCPFHADRHPSFYVNPDKEMFLCRACGEGGDVFKFVMRANGLTFPQAKHVLGIADERKPRRALTPNRKRAAELVAAWINDQQKKLDGLIAERFEQRDLADEIGDFDLAEVFNRELIILHEMHESIVYSYSAVELLGARDAVEQITEEF